VLELTTGHDDERGCATGAERLEVLLPYPVTLVPAELSR
jgi:hypothetical protein